MERREFLKTLGVGTAGVAVAAVTIARPGKLEGEKVLVEDLSELDVQRLQEIARGGGVGPEEVMRIDIKDYMNTNPGSVNYGVGATVIGYGNGKTDVVWRVAKHSASISLQDEVEFQAQRMEVKLRERHDAKRLLGEIRSRGRRDDGYDIPASVRAQRS
jgi:hypothetical protein